MSLESRLRKLEALHAPPPDRHTILQVIGRVEQIIRIYLGANVDTRTTPDPPAVTAKISFSVRTVLEVMEQDGPDAGWRWSEGLAAELIPDVVIILRAPEAEAERAAFDRGDLTDETWQRRYPERPGWEGRAS